MAEASINLFDDEVARVYDKALVPVIFEPYAQDIAARVKAQSPNNVLEVACGTGVVTRALANVLPHTCAITATDLSGAMVAYGERIGTARFVKWHQADAMALPYADESFDVVVCQFGAMFFPDRVTAYREVRRVLRPHGTFLFNVWGSIEDNEFTAVVMEALSSRYPHNPIEFMARIPHGYGSATQIESDVRSAGFATCNLSQRDDTSTAVSPEQCAIALCQGTPVRNEIEKREPGGLEHATAAAAEAIRQRFGDGQIRARMSAFVVNAKSGAVTN